MLSVCTKIAYRIGNNGALNFLNVPCYGHCLCKAQIDTGAWNCDILCCFALSLAQRSSVTASGHLPLSRDRPTGSFMAGTCTLLNARHRISLETVENHGNRDFRQMP